MLVGSQALQPDGAPLLRGGGSPGRADAAQHAAAATGPFWRSKRVFDVVLTIAGAPVVLAVGSALLLANPVVNRGPLLFWQRRMGRGGRPFWAAKFRTMRPEDGAARGPDDPVEEDRITPLGRFLRRSRLDELPQFWNVLRGEMSLIGPRPDIYEHALHYAAEVPGYAERHSVRPGISGYAQVTLGYVEGSAFTYRKALKDRVYIEHACWALETRIILRTMRVMASGFGAK